MTAWFEGKRGFYLGAQAAIIEDDRETASSWASKHVIHNPAYKWVLGRFVEADRANNNRQLFSLDGLQMARPSIQHAPMNMNHSPRRVVGAYVATEMIYPVDEQARDFNQEKRDKLADDKKAMPDGSFPIENETDLKNAIKLAGNAKNPGAARAHIKRRAKALGLTKAIPEEWAALASDEPQEWALEQPGLALNPFIEALGVFWRHYFPEDYRLVEDAHAEGRLFYSMECIPQQIQCSGNGGCGETYEYAGRTSDTYCEHLNESASDKFLIHPHFTAGAILVPPIRPGWSNADVHSLVAASADHAEQVYEGIKSELPHLAPKEWEALMTQLLLLAK